MKNSRSGKQEAYHEGIRERRETLGAQIQEETDEELSVEEIDAILEDRKEEFHEQIVTQFMNNVPDDQLPSGGEEAVRAMGNTMADAVLNEKPHDEFVAEMNAAEDTLQEALLGEIILELTVRSRIKLT